MRIILACLGYQNQFDTVFIIWFATQLLPILCQYLFYDASANNIHLAANKHTALSFVYRLTVFVCVLLIWLYVNTAGGKEKTICPDRSKEHVFLSLYSSKMCARLCFGGLSRLKRWTYLHIYMYMQLPNRCQHSSIKFLCGFGSTHII